MARVFTNDRLGRLGLGTIVAVAAGVAFLGICDSVFRALGAWLLYVIVCAILINSEKGERLRILSRLTVLPAVAPLLVWAYPALILRRTGLCVSGARLTERVLIAEFCVFFIVVSWLAITLFAFSRARLIQVISVGSTPETETRILQITKTISAVIGVLGTVGLLFLAVTGQKN